MNKEHYFEQILDEALTLLQKGKTIPEILKLFPEFQDELKEVLEVSSVLQNEKQVREEKEIFANILSSLPQENIVTQTQKRSYMYRIREVLSTFSLTSFFMNKSFSLGFTFVALVAIIGIGFLSNNFYSREQIDDWKFTSAETTASLSGSSKKGSGFLSRAIKNLSAGKMTQSTSLGSNSNFQPASVSLDSGNDTFGIGRISESAVPAGILSDSESLGLSVGGAKDINNFRENIKNGYLPLPSDITYEGLFYDYYFDTGKTEKCDTLFCPAYATAISKDPISAKDEYYMSVGLNSNLTASDFKRKKLNLVVVLDISGSMESPFDHYYYDKGFLERLTPEKTKMEIAKNVVADLTKHLKKDDSFGMVLFDDEAYLAKPLSLVGETDMDKIRSHIKEIASNGGTNMTAGMEMGTDLFKDYKNVNTEEYENRIIFLTDAMPNTGDISRSGMMGRTEKNATEKIYSTFIGIGVDFNTDLIESITKVKGANYYSVHNEEEFKTRVDEQFDYMVTPLVFDLTLKVESSDFAIEKIYGSPEADQSTGEIMKVNTLFPSPTKGGETKGGLVLLKLKKIGTGSNMKVSVSYEDRTGKKENSEKNVALNGEEKEHYDALGIRKGIVLARYANLLKDWTLDERGTVQEKQYLWDEETPNTYVNEERGIAIPPPSTPSEWERNSLPLSVSSHYREMFQKFTSYLEQEKNALNDKDLQQEIDLLKILTK